VYVADAGNSRIQGFTSDGTFLTKWGGYGEGDGEFRAPVGVATDVRGHFYVADTGNSRVQVFHR
jgi:DNA-binding beta-propeller fold protein YncE